MNDASIAAMTNPFDLLAERLELQSASEIAREIGVSRQYLHQVVNRDRTMGPKILAYLGIEKQVTYQKRNGANAKSRGRNGRA